MEGLPLGRKHEFWNTQPVIQAGEENPKTVGPLAPPRSVRDISSEPLVLPSTFEWWSPDFSREEDLEAVYVLLKDNYVEDRSSTFRFNYSIDFLRWALTPPGHIQDWNVAVRRKSDKMMLGFIAGTPIKLRMGGPSQDAQEESEEVKLICQIDFLCVVKQLRVKKLAPILIKEVTRRVNLCDIWQAVYTTGKNLPTPFSRGSYFHRLLNAEKVVGSKFSSIPSNLAKFSNPIKAMQAIYLLPKEPVTPNLRPMELKDVPEVARLLSAFSKQFPVAPVFTEEEVAHLLLPREGVVYTYVVNGKSGLTDFFSFYSIPSSIIGNPKYSELRAAYIYYYASEKTPLVQLIRDLLIIARNKDFDVCNMVEIMHNHSVVEELKFRLGDGSLYYHFYNWGYPWIPPSKVGLVML